MCPIVFPVAFISTSARYRESTSDLGTFPRKPQAACEYSWCGLCPLRQILANVQERLFDRIHLTEVLGCESLTTVNRTLYLVVEHHSLVAKPWPIQMKIEPGSRQASLPKSHLPSAQEPDPPRPMGQRSTSPHRPHSFGSNDRWLLERDVVLRQARPPLRVHQWKVVALSTPSPRSPRPRRGPCWRAGNSIAGFRHSNASQ